MFVYNELTIINRPESLTDEVWDYIFYGEVMPQSDIPAEALK